MEPIESMTTSVCRSIQTVFTDIDDTLSTEGQIPGASYQALWDLSNAGINVIPVTGRPAGWCDMVARMWPVDAVIGENGALAYAITHDNPNAPPSLKRLYSERPPDAQSKLDEIKTEVLRKIPGCKVASDQAFRMYDLAIDFCEEVPALDKAQVDHIAEIFRKHGATAKISSIHVNGWFGQFDKLSMCKRAHLEFLGTELTPDNAIFVGDSPNDEPNFAYFNHSVGVANVKAFSDRMKSLPTYVTQSEGGQGFAEFATLFLSLRQTNNS